MTDEVIELREAAGVLHATMTHPPANALGSPLVEGLGGVVNALVNGPAKVLVLSSSVPGFFAAGADIKHMSGLTAESFADYRDALRDPLRELASCRRPAIAAIDGLALGGGLELAMACTLRFASSQATVGLPEVKLGLIPGAGGTQRLPRLVGRGRALEIMLSGRTVLAAEAARIGLVDRLVDGDVVTSAIAFAEQLAGYSAAAMEAIIGCVDLACDPSEAGMAFEGRQVVRMIAEGEAREGIAAFLDKRQARFA